ARRYRDTAKRRLGRELPLADDSSAAPGAALPGDTPTPSKQAMAHEQAEAPARALTRPPEEYRQGPRPRHRARPRPEGSGRRLRGWADAARLLFTGAVARLRQEMGDSDEP